MKICRKKLERNFHSTLITHDVYIYIHVWNMSVNVYVYSASLSLNSRGEVTHFQPAFDVVVWMESVNCPGLLFAARTHKASKIRFVVYFVQ